MRRSVLVVGGGSNLGRAIISCFAGSFDTLSIDFAENAEAAQNIVIKDTSFAERIEAIADRLKDTRLAGVYCAAGGWERASLDSPGLKESLARMYGKNCEPSLLAAHIAGKRLEEGGHLVLTGACSAYDGPLVDQISYDFAKHFVHTLALNLGRDKAWSDRSLKAYALLPTILDTPENHKAFPAANKEAWIPPSAIAVQLCQWLRNDLGPANGSLVALGYKRKCLEMSIK